MAYIDEPIDPKLIDHECPISTDAAAISGANPRDISIGVITMTGTPKPAIPCRKEAVSYTHLYGVLSTYEDNKHYYEVLSPVLSLKARIASVRNLDKGEYAGYGLDFKSTEKMHIAILSIGYADGLPRNLSNMKGYVLINGRRAPIIGRICMDMTLVDISNIPDVCSGDIAVIICLLYTSRCV